MILCVAPLEHESRLFRAIEQKERAMRISERKEATVRHDLDIPNLMEESGLALGGQCSIDILGCFGGHREKFCGQYYLPGELRRELRRAAQQVAVDYQTARNDRRTSHLGYWGEVSRKPVTATGILVFPELGWNWHQVLEYMWQNGLRPASFYRHIAIVTAFRVEIGERTAIPFGGWPNPQNHHCVGLVPVRNNTIWYSEGGAGLARGDVIEATSVCFTAIVA